MGGRSTYTVADRQTSVQIQQSAYGGPIPVVYGTNRIAGNMVWQANFKAKAKTTTQGGKGLGGGGSSNTDYTYSVSAILALCEGPIASVGTVWKDSATTSLAALNLTLFTGTATQSVWSFLSGYSNSTTYAADAEIGYYNYASVPAFASQAINYSSTAYLASPAYDLADAAAVPNHNFELTGFLAVGGGNVDANPGAIIPDMLTSQQYGMGFNSGWIGSLSAYSSYCQALGLFISPAYIAQRPGTDVLQEIADATNAAVLWSGGVLNVIPYGDTAISGNGATFTPDLTPLYDFTDDDFLPGDGGPVKVTRSTPADAYNRVAVQFKNRANQYNQEIAYAEDQDAIEKYGLKIASTITMDFVCVPSIAKQMTQLALQRLLYKRNAYEFSLNARFPMLEPMDIVTLTDAGLGLAKTPVRITGIEEIDDGFQVTAEDLNAGVSQAATYAHDSGVRWTTATEIAPASPAAPIIFELPADPSATGLSVAIAAGAQSGDVAYGGCNVWLSLDGTNYRHEGTIYGSSRYGNLTATLAAHAAGSDTTSTARLALRSSGQILSGSAADVAKGTTLVVCDGEYFAYQTATLTGANAYDLTTLNRGLYGTPTGAHASGSAWVRVDGAIATLADLDLTLVGQMVYIKLTAFNIYGQAEQDLSAATAYTYTISGNMKALETPVDFATGVGGSTKPAFNATRNEDGANMLESPLKLDTGQSSTSGAYRQDTGSGGAARDRYRIRLDENNALYYVQLRPIPVSAGEKLWVRAWLYAEVTASGTAQFGIFCYDSTDTYTSNIGCVTHDTSLGAGWYLREAQITVPAGATQIRPYFQRYGGVNGGNFYLAEPVISRGQSGATVGAPTGTPVGSITAGDVSSTIKSGGGVENNQVGTGALIANAVTNANTNVDFTGGGGACLNTYITLASATVTTTGAGDAALILAGGVATAVATATGSGTMTNVSGFLRVMRNGSTVIRTGFEALKTSGSVPGPFASLSARAPFSIIDSDVPGAAGTYTYTLECQVTQTGGTGTIDGIFSTVDGTFIPILLKR